MRIPATSFILSLLLMLPVVLQAQFTGPLPSEFFSISQNTVTNMQARGDTLWIGPRLNYNVNNSHEWFTPEEADSVLQGRGSVFSLAISGDTIVAGIGYTDLDAAGEPHTQMGIYFSTDAGETFVLSDTSRTLDTLTDDNTVIYTDLNDRELTLKSVQYGGQEILMNPVVVPQQSPPYDVAFKNDVVFFAGWASGLRRSTDFGQSWEPILLPPYEFDELTPESSYDFIYDPVQPASGSFMEQNYPMAWLNFAGFSVMIDQDDNVWAGTAGGINISDNALSAPADSVRWRHVRFSGSSTGLLGNWVINIQQNPYNGEVWMTNQLAVLSSESNGLVSTNDMGETFRHHLPGEIIHDIAFDQDNVYAVGNNGLFISSDNGESWRQISQIRSPNTFIKSTARYFSLAVTSSRLWVGTNDGIASSADQGDSWSITRTNMPLSGGNRFQEDAPNVSTYAYPNPFSPRVHEVVRIRFEMEQARDVKVEIFDFGMNLIKTFRSADQIQPGEYEVVWNGFDEYGRQVANGPAFYRISAGGTTTDGKIMIIE